QVAWFATPQALGSVVGLMIIRRMAPRGRVVEALAIGAGLVVLAFVVFGVFTRRPGLTVAALLIDSAGLATTLAVAQIVIVRAVSPVETGIALGLSVVLY